MDKNLNQLVRETGKTYRTIKKRLDSAGIEPVRTTNKKIFYDSDTAIEAINENQNDLTEYMQEKARLTSAQADKTEIEVAKLRSELVPTEQVAASWSRVIAHFRAAW